MSQDQSLSLVRVALHSSHDELKSGAEVGQGHCCVIAIVAGRSLNKCYHGFH